MSKVDKKLQEIESKVGELKEEADKRITNLGKIIDDLKSDLAVANEKQRSANEKIGAIENEIKIHESNIADEKNAIEKLKSDLSQLKPELELKQDTQTELTETIGQLKEKLQGIESDISVTTSTKEGLEAELAEKQEAFSDLEQSIDKDLEKYQQELLTVKEELQSVIEANIIWDYIFEQITEPKVEIIAIIAANRGISQNDIKAQVTSVSPVLVGRAITTLENDGKIVNNNGVWDLSPSLLDVI